MGVLFLGLRNIYRNQARGALIILVLGLSVGLFVTMRKTGINMGLQAAALKREAGTYIEVNVKGSTAYVGTVDQRELPADISRIRALPNIVKVERYVRRQFVDNKKNPPTGVLTGLDPGGTLRLQSMGGFIGSPKIIEGRGFSPDDADKPVAIVGTAFVKSRGVGVGDKLLIPGIELKRGKWIYDYSPEEVRAEVIGIFSVGVVYGDNQVFVPLRLAQKVLLNGEQEKVGQYFLIVDSAENVKKVATALKDLLGDRADLISQDVAALSAAKSLDAVSANGRVGAAISAAVGALVVLLTMILVTRERTREIGILKAIGASNSNVAGLFTAETIGLATAGGLLGVLIYVVGGKLVATIFIGSLGVEVKGNVAYTLTWSDVSFSLLLVLFFGILGSIYPVFNAVRMRPSDAIRQQ